MKDLLNPPAIVKQAEELADLAVEINANHRLGREASKKGLEHYRKAGERLIKAQELCRSRGETWTHWLKANVECSPRQANRYMEWVK
jgi:hypothetical protein